MYRYSEHVDSLSPRATSKDEKHYSVKLHPQIRSPPVHYPRFPPITTIVFSNPYRDDPSVVFVSPEVQKAQNLTIVMQSFRLSRPLHRTDEWIALSASIHRNVVVIGGESNGEENQCFLAGGRVKSRMHQKSG